ncbi:extracellular solute-binding protein [Paenibacillus ginsengarvi]|uniref:Extracellular solute-binding protein n=1 Tax=Paenibacillus ginsengarvi TaxID=400777 RepID=A0A3B0BZD8_9BACL|nr:extracellular solute-binding protein [Paenibacillus ginsengarvi]RKN79025.1 extracellular solute-binding protein [Paenibacillus ginsengarvi]
MITSGQLPDIVLTHNGMLAEMKDKGLTADLSPLIKTQNFALDRFDPVYIDSIRAVSDKGELYAIPYGINYTMLFYNTALREAEEKMNQYIASDTK